MKLGELIPGNGWGYGSDSIKIIAKTAAVDFEAVYLPAWGELTKAQQRAATQKGGWNEATWVKGWYALSNGSIDYTANKNSATLPFGTCVLAFTATTGACLTSSGEVVQSEDSKILFELVSTEWKFIGNCTPVNLTLADFVPGNGWGYGSDSVKIIARTAAVDFEAVYLPEWAGLTKAQQRAATQKGGWTAETWVKGWYALASGSIDYTANKNAVEIPAGAGMLAFSATTGATISIPTAL